MIKVLIVDDEKPICDLIDLNLSAAGYHTKAVQDGLTAIEMIEKEDFDLVEKLCEPLPVYAELVITASEKRYSISYLLVDKDENIIAYTKDLKADKDAFKKGVVNFLNYYNCFVLCNIHCQSYVILANMPNPF